MPELGVGREFFLLSSALAGWIKERNALFLAARCTFLPKFLFAEIEYSLPQLTLIQGYTGSLWYSVVSSTSIWRRYVSKTPGLVNTKLNRKVNAPRELSRRLVGQSAGRELAWTKLLAQNDRYVAVTTEGSWLTNLRKRFNKLIFLVSGSLQNASLILAAAEFSLICILIY